jgi:MEMO1 family protein
MGNVRPPMLAGSWYPAQPERLRARVEAFLAAAEPARRPQGTPLVAVAPHAGYEYSGPTAGKLYGLLRPFRYEAVFILAPSHRTRLARAALSSLDAFATPLGEVPVARAIVDQLAASPCFEVNDRAHADEHAVEIQLPLLQCALPAGTPIVPILIPRLDDDERRRTAAALANWHDDRHLFVVSSDFTHYGNRYGYVPFTDDVPARLEQLDAGAFLKILAHDADGLAHYGDTTGITMCGLDAAAVAITGPRPPDYEAALVDYTRSGDAAMSVSYGALLLCGACAPATLDADDRAFLLALARAAVVAAVRGLPAPDPRAAGQSPSPRLQRHRGAFVTLTTAAGDLRGCIGTIEPQRPLVEAVVANARAAALEDPRFHPVREAELAGLQIEVSALTPLRRVSGPAEIEIGRHGILLAKRGRRAVFLPQVAPEQGWDLPTTLDHLARKAGLAAGDWRNETDLHIFEAEIAAEEPR